MPCEVTATGYLPPLMSDEAHVFAASDQPRQAAITMKHLAGSYLRVYKGPASAWRWIRWPARSQRLDTYLWCTPEGKVPLQKHATCSCRTV